MKQKVFETKKGVALYVDLEKVEYSTTDIDAVKTALNEDLNSSKPLDRSAAEMVLSMIKNIDDFNSKTKYEKN